MTRERQKSDARLPLHVMVMTRPSLANCWSLNVSTAGMSLVAAPRRGAVEIQVGRELDLELTLPECGWTMRPHARITWVQPGEAEGGGLLFGVEFVDLGAADRTSLAIFLRDYRYDVAVVHAAARERELCERALARRMRLHFIDDESELRDIVSRLHAAAVVMFGADAVEARAAMVRIAPAAGEPALGGAGPSPIQPARLIYCAVARPEELIRWYSEGRIYQALSPPVDAHALELAVLRACEDYAVRLELYRVTQELERVLWREWSRARPEAEKEQSAIGGIVTQSTAMRGVLELLWMAAPRNVPVLLEGETGTGKELLAHAIHALSERSNEPFVTQDCGALTDTLLDSELFGHVRGAFTGAVTDHPGIFVTADGGTVFLDEIENTTPLLQAKLLRVLETGEVRPVGGVRKQHVDLRVVVATNSHLAEEVQKGRFRADLFYRLNMFPIRVPPLRERKEDVSLLVRHFLQKFNEQFDTSAGAPTPRAEEALLAYPWPGNVRELRNVIERAVLLSEPERPIDLAQLPEAVLARAAGAGGAAELSLDEQVDGFERALIGAALERYHGVLNQAAKALRTNPVTLGRKAKRLGLWPR